MADIPLIMLLVVIGVIGFISVMGYLFRSKFPISALLFFSGVIWLIIFVTSDNIQLAFSEPETQEEIEYDLTYPMNVLTGSTGLSFSTTVFGIAEKPANADSLIYNQKISCIVVDMDREGSPTGTATIGILDNDNMVVKQFGTISASTVNLLQRSYTFCLPNHDYYTLSQFDRVGVKYIDGSGANTLRLFVDTTNPFDGVNTHRTAYVSGAWSTVTGEDMHMSLITEDIIIRDIPIEGTEEPLNYAIRDSTTFEPTFIGISFILLSLCFIISGVLVESKRFN